ncbi:MerR family transcriptional regulator [Pedobacter sp. AW1-32]|uniref:MerR family transcriptional regulator n=1 Tax=Pedobacter sp. AW1-32 TaxID=3383026 RepID=UPI003FEEB0FD
MYTISDLEQLSGIQAHTIRIWEQRYNALKPVRSAGNTRAYDDEQLKKLLNIVTLNKAGLKISKICKLTAERFKTLLDRALIQDIAISSFDDVINSLIQSAFAFDENTFHSLADSNISVHGLTICYKNIFYPLLVKLGMMWQKSDICPAHEHFISNLIRQKICRELEALPLCQKPAATWLLFLPEDDDHDIGLLFASYLLRLHNQKVVFLGTKMPLKSVESVMKDMSIDHVFLFIVRLKSTKIIRQYINQLMAISKNSKIHLAGNRQMLDQLPNDTLLNKVKNLDEFVAALSNPKTI